MLNVITNSQSRTKLKYNKYNNNKNPTGHSIKSC